MNGSRLLRLTPNRSGRSAVAIVHLLIKRTRTRPSRAGLDRGEIAVVEILQAPLWDANVVRHELRRPLGVASLRRAHDCRVLRDGALEVAAQRQRAQAVPAELTEQLTVELEELPVTRRLQQAAVERHVRLEELGDLAP